MISDFLFNKNIIPTLFFIIVLLIIIIILLTIFNMKVRNSERVLKESEELFRTAINSLPDIICFKDAEGCWLEANEAMLSLYNTDILIIGKKDKELGLLLPHFKEEFKACEETDKFVWQRGQTTMVEESFRQPNGEIRSFDVAKVPLYHADGRKKGLVVLGREITERKKAEEIKRQAEESNRLLKELKHYDKIKTEFFANLSHELRTPLNLILGTIQLLQLMREKNALQISTDKLDTYLSTLRQNCYRLIRLVNNLIDITKIDAGYLELQKHSCNVVNIIEDITLSVKDYIEAKGLHIIFDTDTEEKIICCDPDKLERIVLNLLSNAIKFTDAPGSIEVAIMDKDDWVKISIKDTGIGIPQSKRKAIFERFVQVDKSFTRSREGSGIGLSLVKSFVEMHGGRIHINDEYTLGSEFIIELPAGSCSSDDVILIKDIVSDTHDNKVEVISIEFSDIYS
jgi:PAS domain S-box-containing protein